MASETFLSTGSLSPWSMWLKAWISPVSRPRSSVLAPASSSALRGSVSSTCSTPSVARIAIFLPSSLPMSVPFRSGALGLGYRRADSAKRARLARVRPVPAGAQVGTSAGYRTEPIQGETDGDSPLRRPGHPGRREHRDARAHRRDAQEGLLDGDRDGDELHRQLDQPRRRAGPGDHRVAAAGHHRGARACAAVRAAHQGALRRRPGSLEFAAEQSYLQPPDEQTDIVHVIKGVIEAETGAIEHYNALIDATDQPDPVT